MFHAALRPAAADAVPLRRGHSRLQSPPLPGVSPQQVGYAYARGALWAATQAARIMTVSEASKRDILATSTCPTRRSTSSRTRSTTIQPAARSEQIQRVRERSARRSVRALRRQHQAAQNLERLIEAFHLFRKPGFEHVELLIIGDEITVATLRRAVTGSSCTTRPLLRVRVGRHAGRALPPRGGVRVPVTLRKLRPAPLRRWPAARR